VQEVELEKAGSNKRCRRTAPKVSTRNTTAGSDDTLTSVISAVLLGVTKIIRRILRELAIH
jgi:hypothetical protein